MKKVALTHLSAENFCGIESLDTDLWERTIISGFNREGKSTIANAVYWLFTGKTSDNASVDDSIRPHDANGVRKDFVDITVSGTIGVDSEEFTLTKTQKQKWVKKRGSEDREFQGNENVFSINGVPKSQKDFYNFIEENICSVDELPFYINSNAFWKLDAKKRREKVLSLADNYSDDDVIDKHPEFETLRSDLKVGTVDEIAKRDKANIKALKDRQKELPARIDEVSKSIVHEDFAELELQKNALKEKLLECEAKASEEITLQTTISKLKGELTQIAAKLTESVNSKKHELEMKAKDIKSESDVLSTKIKAYEDELEYLEQTIENRNRVIAETEVNLDNAIKREIGQISLFCPTCGQLMPDEKQNENKAKLEEQKRAEMDRYSDYLETLKAELKASVEKVKAIRGKLPDMTINRNQLLSQVTDLEKEISSMTEVVNYEDDPEYIAKQKEITDLESKLPSFRDYKSDKYVIKEQLEEIDFRLGKAAANEKAKERVEQLKEEQKIVGQNILKAEAHLDLLDRFSKARIEMLEESVNSYFEIIKWKFFSTQINGGLQPVCYALVNGESYDGLLNKSDRLLCQIDLCRAFQKAGNINMFLLTDDCESIDNDRLPNTDHQQIMFRRSDNKLKIEKG